MNSVELFKYISEKKVAKGLFGFIKIIFRPVVRFSIFTARAINSYLSQRYTMF